jgi:surface protein
MHTCATYAPACASVCVRVRGVLDPRCNVRALFIGVDREWLGSQAFYQASAFDQNLAAWNMVRVANLYNSFTEAALSSCNQGAIYRLWGATLRAVYSTWSSMCGASCSLTCLVDGNIGTAATAWVTSPTTAATTYGNIADWDVSAVSSMYQLFDNKPTFDSDISKWNVASVSNMQYMFNYASAFNQDIGVWNTARATTMASMFHHAKAFNRNIGSWNVASVSQMAYIFSDATAFNRAISSWNVARVTSLAWAFGDASSFNQNIGSWNVASVTYVCSLCYTIITH